MSQALPVAPALDMSTVGRRWAWGLCWLLFASTVLNYMDRQAVAVVGEMITGEFAIRFEDLGWIIAAFQVSYAFFQVPAGYLADRTNVRWTYAAAVVWWSVSAILVACAPTLGLLMAFRAVLGFGESFNWPCALKVTETVLPPKDRGLGNGIFNSGAAVGAVITPLVVTPLTYYFGWRVAFAGIGACGFIWVVAWLLLTGRSNRSVFEARPAAVGSQEGLSTTLLGSLGLLLAGAVALATAGWFWSESVAVKVPASGGPVRTVETSVKIGDEVRPKDVVAQAITDAGREPIIAGESGRVVEIGGESRPGAMLLVLERAPYRLSAIWLAIALLMVGLLLIARLLPSSALDGADWARSLGAITRHRRFWILVVVSISVNVCWHFLVNWLPTYLKTDRGMAFVAGSLLSALPFLAADVGNLGGGSLSRWLTRDGRSPASARKLVMTGCVALISTGAVVGFVRDNTLTLVLLAWMALGAAAFMANYFAFCQEVDGRFTGLIVGILGGLGNLFAAGFAPVVGMIKDRTGSFAPVFLVVGLLPLVGLATLWLGWGRDDPGPAGDADADLA